MTRLSHRDATLAQAGFFGRLRARREIERLRRLPARQPASTRLLGQTVDLVDAHTFLMGFEEIFARQIYQFRSRREDPLILDGGANIGLATLYWKRLYPAARIVAFEPDPTIFQALARNCREWQLGGIELVNRALWTTAGEMSFWSEGAYAGRLLLDDRVDGSPCIRVPTVRLRDYVQAPVDLLKLDIEGAETDVLLDCADLLDRVEHLFVEYHAFIGQQQRLETLLGVLRSAGFHLYMQPHTLLPSPFVMRLNLPGLSQTLNIFAWREQVSRRPPRAAGTGFLVGSGASTRDGA